MLPSAETQQRASGAQPALQGPRKKDSRGSGADLSMLIARVTKGSCATGHDASEI